MVSSSRQPASPIVLGVLLFWTTAKIDDNLAFGFLTHLHTKPNTRFEASLKQTTTTTLHRQSTKTTAPFSNFSGSSLSPLHALIYGWDDYEEDKEGKDSTTTKTKHQQQPKPVDVGSSGKSLWGGPSDVCDAAGSSIADHLTNDRDQKGSLARLAFAFRPPEHSGLSMKDIETVNVLCVSHNDIEVEAILCESLGCVSLHIPIEFPTSCLETTTTNQGEDDDGKFLSCVLQNLEELDVTASPQVSTHLSTTTQQQQATSTARNAKALLLGSVHLPSWWVSPSSLLNAASLEKECQTVKDILNEEEFQAELIALAQDGLKHSFEQNTLNLNGSTTAVPPTVQKAKCSVVGPAGIGMKALANKDGTLVVMEVLFPFGGPSKQSAESLRAAVLGAVAVAAEQ
jgi:hypothetical protein